MKTQDHSYLDLSVLPELRESILSTDAVVLLRKDLEAIIWANAEGAKLFGGNGIADLLRATLSKEQTIIRQIGNCIAQLKGSQPIIRGFRIKQGQRSLLLQFEIRSITLPGDDQGYLVTNLADDKTGVPEQTLATAAVRALDGFSDAAAILDEYGLPISASEMFADLAPDEETLAELVQELSKEEDRLIKRPVASFMGNLMAVGLGRISDEPSRSLLVLADTNDTLENIDQNEQPPLASEAAENETPETDENNPDESGVGVDAPETDIASNNAIEEFNELDLLVTEQTASLLPPTNAEEDGLEEQADSQEIDKSGNDEISPDLESETDDGAHKQTDDDTIDNHFLYLDEKEDVRFAWSIDRDGIFKSVSPELARTVGPNAADLIGMKWSEIAHKLNLDPDGDVAKKFERQDTWSGKTVLWPVQGTDMSVPVDLAALPVFGADRTFEGFRGFGIIRTVDAIVDAEATGMALVQPDAHETAPIQSKETNGDDSVEPLSTEPAPHEDDPDIIINDAHDADIEDESSLNADQTGDEQAGQEVQHTTDSVNEQANPEIQPDDADNGKVVRLVPKTPQPTHQELSARENHAFEEIGEKLKNHIMGSSLDEDGGSDTRHLDTSLMQSLPVAILVYRTDELLFANQRLLDSTGYDKLDDLEAAGGIGAIFAASDETDDKKPGQQFLLTKDGRNIPIDPVLHTVPWMGERALLLSFAPQDELSIPEPIALEITPSSEIQNILDTASDGIVVMETDGTTISINSSAEALFGLTYDEAAGKAFVDFFAPESQGTVEEYLESLSGPGVERLLNDGRDVIATEKNGGLIPIFLTVSRMESSNKLCAVVRDMTSWKKVEEELIQSRRDAIKASEQKTDFLAHISHEIRTPLNAIIGFSDVMLEEKFGPIENQRYRDYLRDINRSGSHVLELVNDLLDLSKIEAGKLELSFEAVALNQIVAETVALLQPQANSNRIIIRTSLSRAVPKVVADPRSIRQIILNLVSNAIKFSPANSQVIVSTIYESNGEVAMRVRDTGDGMSKSEIEEAMKPFNQLHSISERAGEGTGLGLPLTKALVEANRALFDLESEPGTGTIAHVQFPNQRVLTD